MDGWRTMTLLRIIVLTGDDDDDNDDDNDDDTEIVEPSPGMPDSSEAYEHRSVLARLACKEAEEAEEDRRKEVRTPCGVKRAEMEWKRDLEDCCILAFLFMASGLWRWW